LKTVPDGLEFKNLCVYDLIVAMERQHKQAILDRAPDCADKIVVWHINDPYKLSYKQASREFDKIKNKVEHLAKTL
jgi:protein-tyrosine-phosphatase